MHFLHAPGNLRRDVMGITGEAIPDAPITYYTRVLWVKIVDVIVHWQARNLVPRHRLIKFVSVYASDTLSLLVSVCVKKCAFLSNSIVIMCTKAKTVLDTPINCTFLAGFEVRYLHFLLC